MSTAQTVSVTVKTKYLWVIVGLVLVVLATAPVFSSYLPSAHSPNPPSGPTTTSSNNNGGGGSSGVNCANPCVIYIKNSIFGYNLTQTPVIKAGTTVTWKNIDDTEHTSTSDPGVSPAWNSGVIGVGRSFSFTFNQTGTFTYHCNIHPMTGTIQVVS